MREAIMTTETDATTRGAALAKLAGDINAPTHNDRVLERARKIWAARQLVDAGAAGPGATWKAWVTENLDLCPSRVRELLRVGRATDPAAELKELRQEKAASVAKAKSRGATPRIPENEPARAELAAWMQTASYEKIVREWERIRAAEPAAPPAKPDPQEIPDFLRRPVAGHA
jgi:hypothetical protein